MVHYFANPAYVAIGYLAMGLQPPPGPALHAVFCPPPYAPGTRAVIKKNDIIVIQSDGSDGELFWLGVVEEERPIPWHVSRRKQVEITWFKRVIPNNPPAGLVVYEYENQPLRNPQIRNIKRDGDRLPAIATLEPWGLTGRFTLGVGDWGGFNALP